MFQTYDPMRAKVTNGADLLDIVYPEWYRLVNVETLDIPEPDKCILGSIHPYLYSWLYDGIYGATGLMLTAILAKHGFSGANSDIRDFWIDAVLERRLWPHDV